MARKLAKLLKQGAVKGKLFDEQWIDWNGEWKQWERDRFHIKSGHAFAQPDVYIVQPKCVVCFEVKLTQTEEADAQLEYLYKPLLQHIYQREVFLVQVCKNLRHPIGPHRS